MRLKKVFLFPSVDDMSAVLAPRLDEKLVQLFRENSRFDLVRDPQVLRALSPDDGAYGKAAQSPKVHKEAARITGSDTTAVLRTRNVGNETEMTLELRDAAGELIFSETGSIPGFSAMEARWGLIEKLFRSILAKIPFDGSVTGRAGRTLTLDLGAGSVRQGEEVEVVRIVSLQRHPLLKTVVGTDYVRVGRARVTGVDRAISFAELIEEFSGETIAPGAKVLRARAPLTRRTEEEEPAPRERQFTRTQEPAEESPDPFEDRLRGEFDRRAPRYGQLGGNLQYGSLSHSQTAGGQASEFSGSGIGGNLEGELWITKNWILSLFYGFHSARLAGTGGTIGDSSWSRTEGFVGYRFFPEEIVEGAQITGSIGYQVQDFSVPTPTGTAVSGKKYSGLALRLDGEILFHRNHKLTTGFGFQPFSSLTDAGAAPGSPDGGTVIGFHLGWNYRFADQFWGRLGLQFDTASGNYSNNASVSNKRFAIGPGIFYSF
jgi:hypothetical protein